MTEGEHVTLEVEGPIAWVRLDNPPVNALSRSVLLDLARTAQVVDTADHVAAAIVTGAGRAFAAGGDIGELLAIVAADAAGYARDVQDAVRALAICGRPTIAAVHGFALGGGTEIALACDLRIAARDARFGLPEVQLGLIPGTGATVRLARVVGRSRAKELIMSGRLIDAEEALAIGLVDEVVEPADLHARAAEVAGRFAHSSPDAVRAVKSLFDRSIDPLLDAESAAFAALLGGRDARLGLQAFLDTGRTDRADFRRAVPEESGCPR